MLFGRCGLFAGICAGGAGLYGLSRLSSPKEERPVWREEVRKAAQVYRENIRGVSLFALLQSSQTRAEEYVACLTQYQEIGRLRKEEPLLEIESRPFVGRVGVVPGNVGTWMRGVGLVAGYLAEKHGLVGQIFVCESVAAFQAKMGEIAKSGSDAHIALILPSDPSEVERPGTPQVQHKVAVGVHKVGKRMKVFVFEPLRKGSLWDYSEGFARFEEGSKKWSALTPLERQRKIQKKAREKGTLEMWGSAHSKGLAVYALYQAKIHSCECQVFVSEVPRQWGYGCWVYALRDAVLFAKHYHFFNEITVASSEKRVKLQPSFTIESVQKLPSDFMVCAAEPEFWRKIKENPYFSSFPATVASLEKKTGPFRDLKGFNQYIPIKTLKYSSILIEMLRLLPAEELRRIEQEVFVR